MVRLRVNHWVLALLILFVGSQAFGPILLWADGSEDGDAQDVASQASPALPALAALAPLQQVDPQSIASFTVSRMTASLALASVQRLLQNPRAHLAEEGWTAIEEYSRAIQAVVEIYDQAGQGKPDIDAQKIQQVNVNAADGYHKLCAALGRAELAEHAQQYAKHLQDSSNSAGTLRAYAALAEAYQRELAGLPDWGEVRKLKSLAAEYAKAAKDHATQNTSTSHSKLANTYQALLEKVGQYHDHPHDRQHDHLGGAQGGSLGPSQAGPSHASNGAGQQPFLGAPHSPQSLSDLPGGYRMPTSASLDDWPSGDRLGQRGEGVREPWELESEGSGGEGEDWRKLLGIAEGLQGYGRPEYDATRREPGSLQPAADDLHALQDEVNRRASEVNDLLRALESQTAQSGGDVSERVLPTLDPNTRHTYEPWMAKQRELDGLKMRLLAQLSSPPVRPLLPSAVGDRGTADMRALLGELVARVRETEEALSQLIQQSRAQNRPTEQPWLLIPQRSVLNDEALIRFLASLPKGLVDPGALAQLKEHRFSMHQALEDLWQKGQKAFEDEIQRLQHALLAQAGHLDSTRSTHSIDDSLYRQLLEQYAAFMDAIQARRDFLAKQAWLAENAPLSTAGDTTQWASQLRAQADQAAKLLAQQEAALNQFMKRLRADLSARGAAPAELLPFDARSAAFSAPLGRPVPNVPVRAGSHPGSANESLLQSLQQALARLKAQAPVRNYGRDAELHLSQDLDGLREALAALQSHNADLQEQVASLSRTRLLPKGSQRRTSLRRTRSEGNLGDRLSHSAGDRPPLGNSADLRRLSQENADLQRQLGELRGALRAAQTAVPSAWSPSSSSPWPHGADLRLPAEAQATIERLEAQVAELQAAAAARSSALSSLNLAGAPYPLPMQDLSQFRAAIQDMEIRGREQQQKYTEQIAALHAQYQARLAQLAQPANLGSLPDVNGGHTEAANARLQAAEAAAASAQQNFALQLERLQQLMNGNDGLWMQREALEAQIQAMQGAAANGAAAQHLRDLLQLREALAESEARRVGQIAEITREMEGQLFERNPEVARLRYALQAAQAREPDQIQAGNHLLHERQHDASARELALTQQLADQEAMFARVLGELKDTFQSQLAQLQAAAHLPGGSEASALLSPNHNHSAIANLTDALATAQSAMQAAAQKAEAKARSAKEAARSQLESVRLASQGEINSLRAETSKLQQALQQAQGALPHPNLGNWRQQLQMAHPATASRPNTGPAFVDMIRQFELEAQVAQNLINLAQKEKQVLALSEELAQATARLAELEQAMLTTAETHLSDPPGVTHHDLYAQWLQEARADNAALQEQIRQLDSEVQAGRAMEGVMQPLLKSLRATMGDHGGPDSHQEVINKMEAFLSQRAHETQTLVAQVREYVAQINDLQRENQRLGAAALAAQTDQTTQQAASRVNSQALAEARRELSVLQAKLAANEVILSANLGENERFVQAMIPLSQLTNQLRANLSEAELVNEQLQEQLALAAATAFQQQAHIQDFGRQRQLASQDAELALANAVRQTKVDSELLSQQKIQRKVEEFQLEIQQLNAAHSSQLAALGGEVAARAQQLKQLAHEFAAHKALKALNPDVQLQADIAMTESIDEALRNFQDALKISSRDHQRNEWFQTAITSLNEIPAVIARLRENFHNRGAEDLSVRADIAQKNKELRQSIAKDLAAILEPTTLRFKETEDENNRYTKALDSKIRQMETSLRGFSTTTRGSTDANHSFLANSLPEGVNTLRDLKDELNSLSDEVHKNKELVNLCLTQVRTKMQILGDREQVLAEEWVVIREITELQESAKQCLQHESTFQQKCRAYQSKAEEINMLTDWVSALDRIDAMQREARNLFPKLADTGQLPQLVIKVPTELREIAQNGLIAIRQELAQELEKPIKVAEAPQRAAFLMQFITEKMQQAQKLVADLQKQHDDAQLEAAEQKKREAKTAADERINEASIIANNIINAANVRARKLTEYVDTENLITKPEDTIRANEHLSTLENQATAELSNMLQTVPQHLQTDEAALAMIKVAERQAQTIIDTAKASGQNKIRHLEAQRQAADEAARVAALEQQERARAARAEAERVALLAEQQRQRAAKEQQAQQEREEATKASQAQALLEHHRKKLVALVKEQEGLENLLNSLVTAVNDHPEVKTKVSGLVPQVRSLADFSALENQYKSAYRRILADIGAGKLLSTGGNPESMYDTQCSRSFQKEQYDSIIDLMQKIARIIPAIYQDKLMAEVDRIKDTIQQKCTQSGIEPNLVKKELDTQVLEFKKEFTQAITVEEGRAPSFDQERLEASTEQFLTLQRKIANAACKKAVVLTKEDKDRYDKNLKMLETHFVNYSYLIRKKGTGRPDTFEESGLSPAAEMAKNQKAFDVLKKGETIQTALESYEQCKENDKNGTISGSSGDIKYVVHCVKAGQTWHGYFVPQSISYTEGRTKVTDEKMVGTKGTLKDHYWAIPLHTTGNSPELLRIVRTAGEIEQVQQGKEPELAKVESEIDDKLKRLENSPWQRIEEREKVVAMRGGKLDDQSIDRTSIVSYLGKDLKRVSKPQPVDIANCMENIINQVKILHNNGIIMRDIKPANILYLPSGQKINHEPCLLIDFGASITVTSFGKFKSGGLNATPELFPYLIKADKKNGTSSVIENVKQEELKMMNGKDEVQLPDPGDFSLRTNVRRASLIADKLVQGNFISKPNRKYFSEEIDIFQTGRVILELTMKARGVSESEQQAMINRVNELKSTSDPVERKDIIRGLERKLVVLLAPPGLGGNGAEKNACTSNYKNTGINKAACSAYKIAHFLSCAGGSDEDVRKAKECFYKDLECDSVGRESVGSK